MPILVDHDLRREELAEVAAEIIAEDGVDAATVRRVSQDAGFSTKAVSHYFEDKRALMMAAYRFAAEHAHTFAEASQDQAGPDARAYIAAMLPGAHATILRDWKVWFAFWSFAIADADFAAEQKSRVDRAIDRVTAALMHDPAFAHHPRARLRRAAQDLVTAVIGISVQAIFDAGAQPRGRLPRPIAALFHDLV